MSKCMHSAELAIACVHIVEQAADIARVIRGPDGGMQIICQDGSHNNAAQARVVCVSCLSEKYPELTVLAQLEPGQSASRPPSANGKWWIEAIKEEELEQ